MSDILPYLGYEEGALVMKDGRICFFYEVDGVEYENWDKKQYVEMVETFESSFREMPIFTTLEKTDIYWEVPNQLQPANDSYLETKRCDHFNKRSSLKHKSYISLTFANEKASRPTPNSTVLARKGKNLPAKLLNDINNRIVQATAKANEFIALVGEIPGVEFRRLEKDEITTLVCQYLNLDFENTEHDIHNEVINSNSHLQIGNKLLNVLSIDGQGDELYPYGERRYGDKNFTNPYAISVHFPLQTPHIVITSMTKMDMETSLKPFKQEVLINKQLSGNSPMAKKGSERALMVEASIDQVRKRKDGFVDFSMSVIVFSEDNKKLQEGIEKTQRAIKGINQANYRLESWDIQNLYFAGLPGNSWENVRPIKMPTTNALPFFHYMKPYVSDTKGELLTDRQGVPTRVDLNHSDIDVMNRIIVGPSGSGKSFTTGVFISTAHERNEIQVIIDKGGSYQSLVKSLGGEYFEHSKERPLRFNPFDTDKDEEGNFILSDEKLTTLITFITVLWKSKGDGQFLEKAENTFLLIWLRAYYQHVNEQKKKPLLKGFVDFVKDYDKKKKNGPEKDEEYIKQVQFFDINHFATVLHPFTEGQYAAIFNNEDAMDLSNHRLICFDVDNIQRDKTLYPVVTMLIIELIFSHIAKFPVERKHVYLDEAWSFFTGEMGEFIQVMYRTIRKFNGDCSVITQGAQDILDSELSNALIQNSQVFIILDHKGKSTDALTKIGLEPFHVEKIKSIRKNWVINSKEGIKGGREIFIKRQDLSFNIYAIEVPIEQYCILTTKKEEKAHFIGLQEKYALNRAIEEWKKDKAAMVF